MKIKCPPPVSNMEPSGAAELRSAMSGNVYVNDEGFLYVFYDQLTKYPPPQCNSCAFLYQGLFRTISVQELEQNHKWLKIGEQYLYPMLVWAMNDTQPLLVRLRPGHRKPVKIMKNHGSTCEAFMICASVTSINSLT